MVLCNNIHTVRSPWR